MASEFEQGPNITALYVFDMTLEAADEAHTTAWWGGGWSRSSVSRA